MKRISKSVVLSAVVLSIISAGFVGCKKGDKDPFISLRSRKARVVGDWKVSKYTSSSTSASGVSTYTDSYSLDGGTYTETHTSNGSTSTDVGVGTWTYKFEKDGKYSMSSISTLSGNTDSYTESGTWNFTGGIGKDVKKKSQIVLTTLSTTRSSTGGPTYSDTYTGADAPIQILQLVELRNKEMIIKMDGTNVSVSVYSGSSSTSSDNTTAEMTLKQ